MNLTPDQQAQIEHLRLPGTVVNPLNMDATDFNNIAPMRTEAVSNEKKKER